MTKPTSKRKKKLLTSFPISDALRQSKYRTDIQRLRFPHGICSGDILGAAKTCSGKVKFAYEGFKKLRSGLHRKCLHGKMKQEGRMGTYSQIREKATVLVSTDVASRGLYFNQAVDWVVQVDCPEDVANHIHRVGQTARCQSEGQSLLFAMPSETKLLEELDAAKKPIDCIKANDKRLQPVSALLSALPVKYPDTGLAKMSFIPFLSVRNQRDKEVFDVMQLPVDEFSASMGLPMTPKICFSNHEMKSKKPLELYPLVEPESSEMDNALETPKEELDIGDLEEGLLRINNTLIEREKETRLAKINLDIPMGSRNVSDEEVPKNCMSLPFGTTILWVQVSRTELLVGVDSQCTQVGVANNHNNNRRLEIVMGLNDQKFLRVFKQVHATIAGDKNRSLQMISELIAHRWNHVQKTQEELAFEDVGWFASNWFRYHPRDRIRECSSIVVLCGWMEHRYEVKIVGDDNRMPVSLQTKVYGCGSGSLWGVHTLTKLTNLNAPIDATILMEEMKKAVCNDPHTGGRIQVFSLKDGNESVRKLNDTLLDELYLRNPVYTNILFNERSMFVVIHSAHRHILGPTDLQTHVESFGPAIGREHVLWLCFPRNWRFIVFLVMLESSKHCSDWFASCEDLRNPIRTKRYTNSDHESCVYCVAHASTEVFDRTRRMISFLSLADPPSPN